MARKDPSPGLSSLGCASFAFGLSPAQPKSSIFLSHLFLFGVLYPFRKYPLLSFVLFSLSLFFFLLPASFDLLFALFVRPFRSSVRPTE